MEPDLRLLSRTADRSELGIRIRETRLAAGMTQADVAEGAFSVAYLSRIESGARRPSPETLEHIATALGTDLDTLLRAPRRAHRKRRPADQLRAHNVARATSAWLRTPTDQAAFAGMLRAVARWEAQVAARAGAEPPAEDEPAES
jgi:transcriptional regulator with XRE-family HTH domain